MNEENLTASAFGAVQYTADEPMPNRLRMIAGVVVILIITVASFWVALNPHWVLRFGNWGYLGAFLISMVASATIILPAPGIAVVIAMGTALDPILLGIVAGMGSAVGELSGYLAGTGGRALVPARHRVQFERLHALTGRHGGALLFLLAAIPFPLFDFAGIIAGMLRMRVAIFLVAVAAGKSIKYIILIVLGAAPLLYLQQLLNLGK
jgi:uncharacterized membrane protein YdjX (TVP38/TMEM64 family)